MSKKKKNSRRIKPLIQLSRDFIPIERRIEMKRLVDFCRAFNVSTLSANSFLRSIGYQSLKPGQLLDEEVFSHLRKKFQNDKEVHDKISRTEIFFRENDSNNTDKEAIFQATEFRIFFLIDNFYSNVKVKISYEDLPQIESYFTDNEALKICQKMCSPFTRRLCENYFRYPGGSKQKEILYQLHFIANKARRIYGGQILSFISQLRPLHFKNRTALEVNAYKKVVPDFPFIQFESEGIGISFFLKNDRLNPMILRHDVKIHLISEYGESKEIATITHNGEIAVKLQNFVPKLTLFVERLRMNKLEFFAGVETGQCGFCRLPLTVPLSLRTGVGPTCAKNNGIDRTLYSFY